MRIVRGKQAADEVQKVANRSAAIDPAAEATAKKIIGAIRKSGEKALLQYARKFDALGTQPVRVSTEEVERACASVSAEFRRSIEAAARNIRQFCEWQKPVEFRREIAPGISVGQVVRPIASVGCYVPG